MNFMNFMYEFYSMGGLGEEDGHQWIKQLREERQSQGAQAPGG